MATTEPELPYVVADERKTIELCLVEHRGIRCVRERGHQGHHECPRWNHVEPLRWG